MNKQLLTRFVVVLTLLLGTLYVGWRWIFSVNWPNWWIAVPLVVAETYALIDTYLFGLTVWRIKRRGPGARAGRHRDRRRLHHHPQRAGRAGRRDRPGGHPDQLPARDVDPRRRRPPRDARRGGRARRRVHHPHRGLARPTAARQGRQPQQRPVRDARRVHAHPRRRPDPRPGDPRPHPRLVPGPRGRPGADAPVVHQRHRVRPARLAGRAVLRPDPAGQGRLERRLLLRVQRGAAARGADAPRHRRATCARSSRPSPTPCAPRAACSPRRGSTPRRTARRRSPPCGRWPTPPPWRGPTWPPARRCPG